MRRRSGRSLTILAAGFLLLDAVLLALLGIWTSRPGLVAWGIVFGVGAVGVVIMWRHYLRRLGELDDARHALRREIGRLSDAINRTRR